METKIQTSACIHTYMVKRDIWCTNDLISEENVYLVPGTTTVQGFPSEAVGRGVTQGTIQ